jgi:hypothetical protein
LSHQSFRKVDKKEAMAEKTRYKREKKKTEKENERERKKIKMIGVDPYEFRQFSC